MTIINSPSSNDVFTFSDIAIDEVDFKLVLEQATSVTLCRCTSRKWE